MNELLSYLENVTGLDNACISRQLSDAPTHDRWLLDTSAGAMVLTVDKPLASQLLLTRVGQSEILDLAARASAGPAPVFANVDRGISLVRYLAGDSLQADQVGEPGNLIRLAHLLRCVHEIDCAGMSPATSLHARIRNYASLINSETGVALAREAEELLQRWEGPKEERVLCHNDVNHGNVICGKSWRLIDWDYAATGSRWFDIATAVGYHQLDESSTEAFLKAYFGDDLSGSQACLRPFLKINRLVTNLWDLAIKATGN